MFDPRNGIGEIPDAANVDYRGFQTYMRPRQFLDLNQPRDPGIAPIDHITDALRDGQPIGTPILWVDKTPEGWAVRGHEGRGRMMALQDRSPSALYPVAVIPQGEVRARHLTPDQLFSPLLPDRRGGVLQMRPPMAIWQQRPYVRPGQEDNPAVLQAIRELLPSPEGMR
jgi:hypothetical protein